MRRHIHRLACLGLLTAPAHGQAPEPQGREHRTEPPIRRAAPDTDPTSPATGDALQRAVHDARAWLLRWGITPEVTLAVDLSTVRGGADSGGTAARGLLDVGAHIDTDHLLGIDDSQLFVDFQWQRGESIREETGSLQDVSNIDAEDRAQLAKLWFQQTLFDRHVRYKLGKADANTDFAYSVHSARFLHPSFGFSPTIVGMPSYPDPSFGGVFELRPLPGLACRAGVYDGAGARGVKTGERGPETLWSGEHRLFSIAEAGYSWQPERGDRLAIGAHYHDAAFTSSTGDRDRGVAGFYAVLDQSLWIDDSPRGRAFGAFGQLGSVLDGGGDPAPIDLYLGAGLVCTSPFAGRPDDACGLAANWARLAPDMRTTSGEQGEFTCELFYTLQVNDWLRLKPDLQWLPDPAAGTGGEAWVFTLRAIVTF